MGAGLRLVTTGIGRELRHRSGAALCVGLAAGSIGLAAASGPTFLSSARSAALAQAIEGACPASSGLTAIGPPIFNAEYVGQIDAVVAGAVEGIDVVAEPMFTSIGPGARVGDVRVEVLHREGLVEELTVLDDAGGDGVFLAASVHEATGIGAGDEIVLAPVAGTQGESAVRVRGVYQDLTREPRRRSLCSIAFEVYGGVDPPPSALVADRATALRIGADLQGDGSLRWEVPLATTSLDAEAALDTARRLRRASTALLETGGFDSFDTSVGVELGEYVRIADDTAGATTPAVSTLAAAGAALGLVLLVVSSWQWTRSLAATADLLDGRGAEPSFAGARVAAAALVPVVVGLLAGGALAGPLVRAFGPSEELEPSALADARRLVLLLVPVALVAVTVTALAQRPRRAAAGPPAWFVPVGLTAAVLAAAAGYELSGEERPPPRRPGQLPEIDRFAVLFPLLAMLAVALLGAATVAAVLRRVGGRPGSRRRPALYLARRRLGHQRRAAATSFAAAALAVGMLAYAATLDASTDATALARARATIGADASAVLPVGVDDPGLPGTTPVRVGEGTLRTGSRTTRVVVLGIDPGTFADVAAWEDAYGRDVDDVADGVADGGGFLLGIDLPPGEAELLMGPASTAAGVPLDIAPLAGFPIHHGRTPTVVIDDRRLPDDVVGGGVRQVWIRGEVPGPLLELVGEDGVQTAADQQHGAAVSARRWSAGYTVAVAAGFGALLVLAIAVAAQRRRSGAVAVLLERMGLHVGAAWWSAAVEVAVPVLAGFATGALVARGVATVVLDPLDAEPGATVPMLTRTPVAALLLLVAMTVAAIAGASRLAVMATRRSAATAVAGVPGG
jgi:putative ABC transport system permease protein